MIRAELLRLGRKHRLTDVVVNRPAGGFPSVEMRDANGEEDFMLPGDVLWLGYPSGKRERIICTHKYGVPYFICTRIGFST